MNVYPDPEREPEDALGTVKIFTCHLNKKLAGVARIQARWGIGYRLVAQ